MPRLWNQTRCSHLLDAELATDDLTVLLQKVLEITTRTFSASVGAVLLLAPER